MLRWLELEELARRAETGKPEKSNEGPKLLTKTGESDRKGIKGLTINFGFLLC